MEGKDLYDYLLKRNFRISEARAKELSAQLGEAVRYMHTFGIIHRDIKLENIMMSDSSEKSMPKIVDFGLSKILGPG